jgi:uncharacterized protein
MKPVHFDLNVRDLAAARRFFGELLGWRFERFPMPYEIYTVKTGPAHEPGIDGTIGAMADSPPATVLTIAVTDLDAMLQRMTASGGSIVEPRMPVPGVGWYATCAEPGGLRFGLMQSDPKAAARGFTG